MVIHKPAGLLSVPGKTADLQDCAINRLLKEERRTLLIHRLDRDTSGLLVFGLIKFFDFRLKSSSISVEISSSL